MIKKLLILLIWVSAFFSNAQEVGLPSDFRQHNLTEFNSSLMNPVHSLDRNNPQSIAFWSRYQWQYIDSDPSSWILNYTRKINDRSSFGVGFIQHNTGVFHNTGGLINYAYRFNLGERMRLSFGLNLFGFTSQLADDRYQPNHPVLLPQLQLSDAFVLQFAPGMRFEIDDFGIGFSSDNLMDYNFNTNKGNSEIDEKVFMGTLDYTFPIQLFNGFDGAYLRPMAYFRSIPYGDMQIGVNALLSSEILWVQGGYNSFYGVSGGIGGRFFKQVSIGALIEFGVDEQVKQKDPSFEIVAAYHFGNPNKGKGEVVEEMVVDKMEPTKKEIREAKRLSRRAKKNRESELVLEVQREKNRQIQERKKADSLLEISGFEEKRKVDSLQQMKKNIKSDEEEIIERKRSEKAVTQVHYEEVHKLEGEKAGFYLIVNIYGSNKYRDLFLEKLKERGINAQFFFVPKQKYDYVYLERYDTLRDAEAARDSKFYGKYSERIWIYRIISD
ncbi:PorP/SprF family type IX secretion system membrane protein [Arenibacter latericius]|uniref:PorP/SprF family type IX secretion system membrane protein n=1 Tax=Arenibacter latericius TaxID=86104 RepID=UPI00041C389C|nr:PorP/SprF family type IX secretion system membrane protein [Arenibacter latericius]MDX1363585.1 PorP/SprF family type IX secretion system membrane protein [Arenibacter latericius]